MVMLEGSCLVWLRRMPAEGVDAVVTDPPYDLGFMGKAWDKTGIAFKRDTWGEIMRVMKPGAHLLSFGGTRTYHRMAVAIEDAGFEVRDMVQWLYGSGFPKSMNVGKAIDKAAGKEREVVGKKTGRAATPTRDIRGGGLIDNRPNTFDASAITAPATPEAAQWEGWGTALKPACEPIVLARKPLGEKTVAGNVLRYGTGALNVDGTRIEFGSDDDKASAFPRGRLTSGPLAGPADAQGIERSGFDAQRPEGRWPANVIMDEEAGAMLDAQTGNRQPGASPPKKGLGSDRVYGEANRSGVKKVREQLDGGGASRFFYCAKAPKSERNAGGTTNNHPTVKPIALMRYLIRLITPPDGHVLDPFAGSGSTGIAAMLEGMRFTGIELDGDYVRLARARIKHWTEVEGG